MGSTSQSMRRGLIRRRPLLLLVFLAMLLPVLVVSAVLWRTFSEQIQESQEKRLDTSLSVMELALQRGVDDFRNSLSRLAADNTLRVTVDLDIRPQLKRYLSGQYEISDYEFVEVTDPSGKPLVTLGDQFAARLGCTYGQEATSERFLSSSGRLILSRNVPLAGKQGKLGYLCAGFSFNSLSMVNSLAGRVDGVVQLGYQGELYRFGSELIPLTSSHFKERFFDVEYLGTRYRGEKGAFLVDDQAMEILVLVNMNQYDALLARSLRTTGFVVFAILLVAFFALRLLGQRQRVEGELLAERKKAEITLASIADGVITLTMKGEISYLNPAAEMILGSKTAELRGLPWSEVFDLQNEATGERVTDFNNNTAETGGRSSVDSVLITRDGRRVAVHYSAARMQQSANVGGFVLTFRDMHKERELRRRLAWKASRDDLTGLLNRSEFSRSIQEAIESIPDDTTHHCLLYLDLDEFKVVNDTCGHKAGDDLLRKVSADIKSQLRESDIVARLGGDEFGILLMECRRDKGTEVAQGLIDAINDKRFAYQGKVFHVGASIGLVSVTSRTTNLEDLLATVDAACYAAKEEGRNRVYVGQVDSDKISHRMEELRQASHIRHALKEGRLMLFRQPIVSARNPSDFLHSEVLVRMVDRDGKLVVPGAFIPVAERHGLMKDVDRWILRHLFEIEGKNLRKWHAVTQDGERRQDAFLYSVNLSATSLTDSTFLDFVKEQMQLYRIPGRAIAFEITETQVITHLDKAADLIHSLKALGCKFLLDDFGSGMSSFGYLKTLPIDYLKIDGLFVKDILTDPIDRSMVNMINEIGHIMGLTTVAEYVENEEILREIQDLGVDMAQGYGISRPVPMEDIPRIQSSSIA